MLIDPTLVNIEMRLICYSTIYSWTINNHIIIYLKLVFTPYVKYQNKFYYTLIFIVKLLSYASKFTRFVFATVLILDKIFVKWSGVIIHA